ncbi:hypothetical protein [Paraliobacillus ryukyuensis]|uniref:hypothetical protein n=1 Tax=Paraliobacillus ryukyuensis TaxID=200904 RepID=UPI0009A81E58|nr:hypothetical protein [Paraliobacillus ryukyuensis]
MGDYWHANRSLYEDIGKKPSEQQVYQRAKDSLKRKDFFKFGFNYYEVWENDIYEDLDKIMFKLFPATTTRKASETDDDIV